MAKSNHYIDNKQFFEAMKQWKEKVTKAEDNGDRIPPVTDYIGECFLKIATNLAFRPNFINYPFRDEMVGDGIENCLMYCKNFNPEKSKNPFSYFTQIIYYAFIRRIQKEKKQNYIKYKLLEEADVNGIIPEQMKIRNPFMHSKNPYADLCKLSQTDIENFEPKKKKKKSKKDGALEEFLDNEDSTDK